jgi:hypothetical protein
MASQGPEAFYAAVRAQPETPIRFGKAQAVAQTPAGQPDQQLKLPTDEEVGLASRSIWCTWLTLCTGTSSGAQERSYHHSRPSDHSHVTICTL